MKKTFKVTIALVDCTEIQALAALNLLAEVCGVLHDASGLSVLLLAEDPTEEPQAQPRDPSAN